MKSFLSGLLVCLLLFSACGATNQEEQASPKVIELNKDAEKEYLITISTEFGEMHAFLYDDCPAHKMNFIALAQEGYFDGTTFHRIIDDFMIQGGDPNSKDDDTSNDGAGSPGYTVPAEITHRHKRGAIAGARKSTYLNPKKESNGSQFYIVENHEGTPHLDGEYSVFGQVISGFEIIDKIAAQPKEVGDRPTKDIKMTVKAKLMKKSKIAKITGYEFQ
ncbi:MAG: peptidylprolyl isomerase [Cytophagales bacterium]|nr:peptidylprolyl isomerase [Cytophagales bacterium]